MNVPECLYEGIGRWLEDGKRKVVKDGAGMGTTMKAPRGRPRTAGGRYTGGDGRQGSSSAHQATH